MVARMEAFDNPLLRRYNVAASAPEPLVGVLNAPAGTAQDESYEIGVIFAE
jgi:hypothetical protein